MRTSILLALALSFSGTVKSAIPGGQFHTADSLESATPALWQLVREPGDFEPAGWQCEQVPALTRAQGVRMGLRIDHLVDERFDPVKGKQAAANYFQEKITLAPEAALVATEGAMLLADIADEANAPLRVLESANPHLRRDILPKGVSLYSVDVVLEVERMQELAGKQQEYALALTQQYEKRRKQVLSFMPDPDTHSAITYTVRSGDYLGRISSKTGASVENIRKWNRIKGNTIYPGQKLTVWVPKNEKSNVAERVAAAPAPKPAESKTLAVAQPAAEKSASSYITYEVKEGDTLWGIAQKFPGVSADQIKAWNKVDELIKAGEKLKIETQTISDYSPDKYPSTL